MDAEQSFVACRLFVCICEDSRSAGAGTCAREEGRETLDTPLDHGAHTVTVKPRCAHGIPADWHRVDRVEEPIECGSCGGVGLPGGPRNRDGAG